MPSGEVVLASRSPQRVAILTQLGIEFEQHPTDVKEVRDGPPAEVVARNALSKALAAAASVGPELLVLGVDTEVHLDGRLLGKPRNEADARRHLESLSGRTHEVFSGLALVQGESRVTDVARTNVRFRALDSSLVDWYLASREWDGRAGAYAVQGRGAALVESIDGDYWNVVGLPVFLLLRHAPGLLGD